MSMTITNSSDRDDEIDTDDDDRIDDRDDEEEDRPKPKAKGRPAESDDDTDEDDEEPDDGWAAEAKRLRAALKKSNATGIRRRNQLKAIRSTESKADDDTDEDEADEDEERPKQKKPAEGFDARTVERRIEKARREERKKAEQEHTRDLIDTRAETALTRAGADEKAVRLLKRELDYDELELLKDRTVEGLDDEIDRLKTEFPNLFRGAKGARRRINGGDDRNSSGSKKPLTVSQQQMKVLRGE